MIKALYKFIKRYCCNDFELLDSPRETYSHQSLRDQSHFLALFSVVPVSWLIHCLVKRQLHSSGLHGSRKRDQSLECFPETQRVLLLAEELGLSLLPSFIQGAHNVLTDILARRSVSPASEWPLSSSCVQSSLVPLGYPRVRCLRFLLKQEVLNLFNSSS